MRRTLRPGVFFQDRRGVHEPGAAPGNLYPLPFSTIAPTVYHVYLHPDDFDAIDGVAARVVDQIQQALTPKSKGQPAACSDRRAA